MDDNERGPAMPAFFSREVAEKYDARNSGLSAISDNMHFLARLVLGDLPARARILCVGVGTGAEILSLAAIHPEWSFVGVDPSAEMLDVCRERLRRAGVLDRCELIRGLIDDVPPGAEFDAVLSILVAHFVEGAERAGFYRGMRDRLRPGGCFVSTEICFDLDSPEAPAMLRNWERVQTIMGATPESLRKLPETLRHTLHVLSPDKTADLLRAAGFELPVQFFQAFLIRGFFAVK